MALSLPEGSNPHSELTTLPCGHTFGHRCIVTWTQAAGSNGEISRTQCPMCRAKLESELSRTTTSFRILPTRKRNKIVNLSRTGLTNSSSHPRRGIRTWEIYALKQERIVRNLTRPGPFSSEIAMVALCSYITVTRSMASEERQQRERDQHRRYGR
ncbi:hypothetical protein F5Y05DRAFT_395774 [Hypoxylon sp. FL0543]|nr:hypothetical protein F5Y05DRAFT_395774 [Hypoxylon sp. FL0543]